ncbi:MAG TPA: pyridoxamine 5'-phosphate oxidase family protein, partial [Deltaproteobacteria bacterium]|nr:pyridoxamine 5'-phosphate oxidase family protein [Deltaproteobacteria bacterium]
MKTRLATFDEKDLKEFEPENKVGLIATVNPEGLPHVTLITAIMAKTPRVLVWGQFSEGLSKKHVLENPKTGFLIMTMDRSLWRGAARWTHKTGHGADYAAFNAKPMFRYNAYTGIHTVHSMDLVWTWGRERLRLGRIVAASCACSLAYGAARSPQVERAMNPWTKTLLGRMDTLTFLSYVGPDGYPLIVPLFACRAPDEGRLAFSPYAYEDELEAVEPGAHVAVYGLSLQMESVLVRGVFRGYRRFRGV